jgi:hypothetical protein
MAFPLSPGVTVSEVDLTTVVPSVLTTAGAFAGYFPWGPVNQITTITSQVNLATVFTAGAQIGPDANSYVNFFTCGNFLSYGNNLQVVRSVGVLANNAVANTTAGATTLFIPNESYYQYSYLSNNSNKYGPFAARYSGALGNSLAVSICANTTNFSTWAYAGSFPSAPGTSTYVAGQNGANDEMHIVVLDSTGKLTGTANTVLEKYSFVSKASNAINNDGTSNWWKQQIFTKSKYIYAMDPPEYTTTNTSWSLPAANTNYAQLVSNDTYTLVNGIDDVGTDATVATSWNFFANKETVNINLVLTGAASTTLQSSIINNVVLSRADCLAFVSPPLSAVVNNAGNEATAIQSWLTSLGITSSYVVADSGWKYQFDQYNNVYRWIPLNGDIAGLCVNTDSVAQPWFSPAGFNRGTVKNVIKLAWNPSKTYRDTLYSAGVNPVVTFPGQGAILFGDKTLLSKPSAFDRISVRRLFIVLEKAISLAAQYSLFEINDSYTQTQFINLVTPYLRNIQGLRGINAFQVVCDSTNNTPGVINNNQFVGDIYIQPARSTNFIQLNFVAVNTGVSFSTLIGGVSSSNS